MSDIIDLESHQTHDSLMEEANPSQNVDISAPEQQFTTTNPHPPSETQQIKNTDTETIDPLASLPLIIQPSMLPIHMQQPQIDSNPHRYPPREKRKIFKPKADYDDIIESSRHLSEAKSSGKPRLTMELMRNHLENVFIGYKPGDTTGDELPDTLPPPLTQSSPDQQVINMSEWSQQHLLQEVGLTATADYFEANLLDRSPGVPHNRVASFTGQPAYKRTSRASNAADTLPINK